MVNMPLCPACGEEATPPNGKKSAKYLIVFSKPYPVQRGIRNKYQREQITGLDVLRKELSKVGLDLSEFRMAYLNMHESKNENCYFAGRDIVLDEAKGKEAVILVGSEVTEEFCGLSAQDTAGLQVDSMSFSAPLVFVLPKPESVFVRGSGIGELRLAVQKLGRKLDD
jgi:hypothetical protein